VKDWLGDKNSVFKTLGASSHVKEEREINDYYATDPIAVDILLEVESFNNVLEPACGEGHISKILLKNGIKTKSCDLIDRGYGEVKDFMTIDKWDGDIITNPPYKFAKQFIEHSLGIIPTGKKVAMFLKVQFLEGKGRKQLFLNNPPKTVYISSSRIACAKNGEFYVDNKPVSKAVAYAWYIWEKGFKGDTVLKWIN